MFCTPESFAMMSDDDRDLLEKLTPDLMQSLEIKASDLLAQLKSRKTLTYLQKEDIEVVKKM